MAKYLDDNGVLYLWGKIKSAISTALSSAKSYTDTAIQNSGFQKNQNAFGKVTVGTTTIAADTQEDTLTFVAGENVTLTPDASGDKLTIAAKDTVYSHPTHTAKAAGLYKVTVDALGHVSAASAVAKSDITGLGIPSENTTYSPASSSADGLMSKSDKAKLDGFVAASQYALKSDLSNLYKFKGSVTNASSLPTSGQSVGDVYNITNSSEYGGAGMNVVWTGTAWDALGEVFTINSITNAEIDTICV